jgi:uncharacterized protein with PIN domain
MVEIIEKVKKKNDTEYVTYICPICHWTLMEIRNYPGGSAVDWKDDCEHYEWYTTQCSPFEDDPSYWEKDWLCRMEKPIVEKLKKKAVLIELDNIEYYYLIPKEKE